MKRDLEQLAENIYDLLVIGGGIYGACVAWEAALRGLAVGLVEKGDFASATSANSLKIIHGGLRYLQHGDLKRSRESMHERRALMRIAPHLVHPMPVLIPTYGHGLRGRGIMLLALRLNDLVGFDRNRLDDPQKHLPAGQVISQQECLALVPGIEEANLTGGAIFYDAQVYNSERLVIAFLHSAAQAGAHLANYAEVSGFLRQGDVITGVQAKDLLTGDRLDIRARLVVNTAGPWVDGVLRLLEGGPPPSNTRLAKAVNLVTRPLLPKYAVGFMSKNRYRDADAVVDRGSRFLFVAPWRDRSLIGTSYVPIDQDPDKFTVAARDVDDLLDDINRAYPGAGLKREDVALVHGGLLPATGVVGGQVQLAKHYQIRDHRRDAVEGLVSVTGVKYTTARNVAEKVLDHVFARSGKKPPKSQSSRTPLYGGQIERFESYLDDVIERRPAWLGDDVVHRLVYNYGTAYSEVLRCCEDAGDGDPTMPDGLAVLKAEIRHGIREEMAQTLSDVVFRRTDLGTAGHPGDEALRFCAEAMAAELGWDQERIERELEAVNRVLDWDGPR